MYRVNEKCHVPWCVVPLSSHGDEHRGEVMSSGRHTTFRVKPVSPRDAEPDVIEAFVLILDPATKAALSIGDDTRLPLPAISTWGRIKRFLGYVGKR